MGMYELTYSLYHSLGRSLSADFITSLALPPCKGSYVFGSIGLSVCGHYSKSYEWIGMKFYGGVLGGTYNEELIKFLW